ncbi:MAG: alpha/beta hydrolase [Myxococcota bacterium]|nr:alpha/beta hydrolase [Myxococcota bacterium]
MSAKLQTRRFDLDDIEIAYSESPGTEPPILLLHGLTGHRDDFTPMLPELADACGGLRVLVPDLRGHGDSTHSGDADSFTFERCVADLVDFLDGLGIDRCHLLGHSLGGMVSLRFALAHPERLASLILMSTSPFAPPGYERETFEPAGAFGDARGMAFLQMRVETASQNRDSKSNRQIAKWADEYWPHHRHRYRAMDPVCYRGLGVAMTDQENQLDRLGELRCPTTVLSGLDDEDFVSGAAALVEGIADAQLVELSDAGHHPHREDTDGWLSAMRAHLERLG